MKVLITGGTGLIGSALARSLSKDGHEVAVLTRDPAQKHPTLPASVRLVRWDGKSGEGWSSEVEGADAIVNLAGETIGPEGGLWTDERKRRIKQSRLDATQAVVDAIRRATQKPRVLVQGSAIGYYGTHADESIVEGAPPGTDFLAALTREWEAASEPVEAMGVRRVLARTGIVLAKKGGSLNLMALPFKFFMGGPLGNGKQYASWIHIDDEVSALRHLIEDNQAHGPFNLTAPNPVTNREMGNVIGKVLSRPNLLPTPGFMLKLVLGEMSTLVLEGQRVLPKALQTSGYDFRFPNLEGALRDLLK
ncbi:MAG: TIGR01777 family protein [Ardenticatenales bacterium]|nr:TIGR01777 family protein [Ardenticatenales bacterium]